MAEPSIPKRVFPKAKDDAAAAEAATPLPQTADPAYRLAYADKDFRMRDELRPVRFQLELMKPELLQEEAGIGSTFETLPMLTPAMRAKSLYPCRCLCRGFWQITRTRP